MSAFMAPLLGQAVPKMLDYATDEIIKTRFLGTPSVFKIAAEAETQLAERSE